MARWDSKQFLEEAGSGRTVMVYKAGDTIFRQGEHANQIFYLQSGSAKEIVTAGKDKVAVTGMLEPGQFFGTGAVNQGQRRRSTVTTVTICQFTVYSREAILAALNEPTFVRLFLSYLIERNTRIEADKVDLLMNSGEKRLAQKLLQLSHAEKGRTHRIGPEITQEMLAEMIGTTRPRVNSFMTKFRKLGYITYNGGIMVQSTLVKVLAAEGGSDG